MIKNLSYRLTEEECDALTKVIKQKGLTKIDLAKRLGVNYLLFRNMTCGRKNISLVRKSFFKFFS